MIVAWMSEIRSAAKFHPPQGESLYLAVTAYDIYGNESDYSEELVYTEKIDSDRDGLDDNEEISIYLTDPNNPDSDSDGVSDGWEVNHGYNPIDACSTPYWEADLDHSGTVNILDYQRFYTNFGKTNCYEGCAGDLDNDGDVDILDYSVFINVVNKFHCF